MINDGLDDRVNQIIGSGTGSCERGCGGGDWYDRWRRRRPGCSKYSQPNTQVGAIAVPIANVETYVQHALRQQSYAELSKAAHVLRQCPSDSPDKPYCASVASHLQQLAYQYLHAGRL